MERFQSRKFTFAILMLGISSLFVGLNKASFDEWTNFNEWMFGLYAGANVTSKLAQYYKSKRNDVNRVDETTPLREIVIN